MARKKPIVCAGCVRLQQEMRELHAKVLRLEEQLAAARKDSTTSSKPPSSDIVKPPCGEPGANASPRAAGGQPGHPKHERIPFAPEQIQAFFDYRVEVCPDCGHRLRPSGAAPVVVQQVDLPEIPLHIEEHRQHESYCPCCDKAFRGVLPSVVERGGLLGPRLTALVAFLKGACHASFSTVRKFQGKRGFATFL
jgi:transposase